MPKVGEFNCSPPKVGELLHRGLELCPSLRHTDRMPTTTAMPALKILRVLGVAMLVGCTSGTQQPEATPLAGSQGRGRWVVTVKATLPDRSAYRALLIDNPAGVAAYVAKMRAEQARNFPEVQKAVTTVNGEVVERWWMSNQLTVELPAAGVATLRGTEGVSSVEPDVVLTP